MESLRRSWMTIATSFGIIFLGVQAWCAPLTPVDVSAQQEPATNRSDFSGNEPAFGHNLTATSYTLPKGRTSMGNYLLAYGITDELMIATSPWLATNYNMPMLGLKYSSTSNGRFFDRLSIETAYLKTFDYGLDWFHQESLFTRMTLTFDASPTYHLHFGMGLQYFWEDRAPFSLRPPPGNDNPYTASISALQEIDLSKGAGLFLETGVLGANYPNPYAHLGGSLFFKWTNFFLQLGASFSIPTVESSGGIFGHRSWTNMYGESHGNIYDNHPIAVHPEIQLQYYL